MRFISKEINERFYNDGFCKIKLLEEGDVAALLEFADQNISIKELQNTYYGMYVSMEEVLERRLKIKEYIQEVVAPKINDHLIDHKIHLGGYLIKVQDGSTYTYPHQDWTFVDNETNDVSATIWIALSDFNEQNGTLGFVKGSHQFLDYVIGSPSPIVKTPARGRHQDMFEHMKFESLQAGEALVFDNKTIHGALPNCANSPRIAIGVGIIPKNAQLHHYFLNPENENELLKLQITDDFFLTYNNRDLLKCYENGDLPGHSNLIGKIEHYSDGYPDQKEIIENCLRHGNTKTQFSLQTGEATSDSQESQTLPNPNEDVAQVQEADGRTFLEKYSLLNIYRETRSRLHQILDHQEN